MRSTDRFLTTHAGSLPRPDDLVRIMYAKEEGQAVERAELASHVRNAVAGVVARQKGAGVDIINDGEMSKPSYATYVKDRLSGFGGTGTLDAVSLATVTAISDGMYHTKSTSECTALASSPAAAAALAR